MNLTKEQVAILQSQGDIKINAVAGAGKTTTILEYARQKPKSARILYLAFNKAVKYEATKTVQEQKLYNVRVETAHSIAFRSVVYAHGYTVKANGYKTHEIAEFLRLQENSEKHTEYIIANHINKFIAYFCNSDKKRIRDLNYLDILTDEKTKEFVLPFYDYIAQKTRFILTKMDRGEIQITHDFYLKKFQLSNPVLPYDYILFDEGQDASPAMLDVFFKQKSTKVIVGDTNQQIYGWRFAINSLEKARFTQFTLSHSFRFNQDIANLAMKILERKKYLPKNDAFSLTPITIQGCGICETKTSRAVLARTNLGLLFKAIEYITKHKNLANIYFEGNINSYTYAEDGASLYDVLSLYNHSGEKIRDPLIKKMRDFKELTDYIQKTEDSQLRMMSEIVKEYGNEIYSIIKELKNKHIEGDNKNKASIIFSTIHRCKGIEYDEIEIVDDFITESELMQLRSDKNANFARLNEEINLLYVAITRAKNIVYIPENLVPRDFIATEKIRVLPSRKQEEKERHESKQSLYFRLQKPQKQKKDIILNARKKGYSSAYNPWTSELDTQLRRMVQNGIGIKTLADHFGRTTGAIRARIKKLMDTEGMV